MADKVQLIKEEIERLDEEYRTLRVKGTDLVVHVLLQISNFIDSLPEESGCEIDFTTKSKDLEEELIIILNKHYYFPDEYDELRSIPELAKYIAYFFAEWQKQKDLEDLLKSDMTMPNKFYEKGKADAMNEMKEALQAEYEKGRFDMMEEMMKDAVELTITNTSFIPLPKLDIKAGDKVKIIILKTE